MNMKTLLPTLSFFFVLIVSVFSVCFLSNDVSANEIHTAGSIFSDAIYNHTTTMYGGVDFNGAVPVVIEWAYNQTIEGTVTKFEMVFATQDTPENKLGMWNSELESLQSLKLYINGEYIGQPTDWTYYHATSSPDGGGSYCSDPVVVKWEFNKYVNGQVLMEIETTDVYMSRIFFPVKNVDTDVDGDIELQNEANKYADGVYTVANDWNSSTTAAVWHWDGSKWMGDSTDTTTNVISPYYRITFSGNVGSSTAGGEGDYLYVCPDTIAQYETADIIYLFNTTTEINHLSIEHNGNVIYSKDISVLDGNLFFTPSEAGVYYINTTRSGSLIASETLTVTEQSKDYFVYVPFSPVPVGSAFNIYIKYSNTDYDGLFTIEDSDGNVVVSEGIGKNDTSVHVLTRTLSKEGKYYLKLYVNNPYVKTLVSQFVLYTKAKEYVSKIEGDKSSVVFGEPIRFTIIHNSIGSDVYYSIYSDAGGYVVSKSYLTDEYVSYVKFVPEKYIGMYQVRLYLHGHQLAKYDFTVSGGSQKEETNESENLLSPFEQFGDLIGVGAEGGKAIAGMLMVLFSIGLVYGVDRQNFVRLPNIVYAIVPLVVSLILTLLGFFPLWVWVIFAIVVFLYAYNKFMGGGGFRIREEG